MLTSPAGTKVFGCTRATDMRCGFDTLAAQGTRFLDQDPLSGHRFVLRGRKGDRIKVLYWDTDGYAPWCKRLEMAADDLGLILRGIDPAEVRRRPRYRKPPPA